ncbi:cytochrome P450 [Streptomonospora halophila]|uniref:Cytochrome P450 n=1 Tax=Streptomonospora halophila TaxID=427369 RepID=A0ABP9G9E3_9ACTN
MLSTTELRFAARLRIQRGLTWFFAQTGDAFSRVDHWPWRLDPYPVYARMHAGEPVQRSRVGVLTIASHETARGVLRDRRIGVRPVGEYPLPDFDLLDLSFLQRDEPDHARLRALARPAFSPRRMAAYRPMVQSVADRLLDAVEPRGRFDLMRDFAAPLPIAVITELLGIEGADSERFLHYGNTLGASLDGARSLRRYRELMRASAEIDAMFGRLVEERRRDPRDDIVSDLVSAVDDERMTAQELHAMAQLLLVAGFETTVNLIGNAVAALMVHRDQWEALRADPGLAPRAVEEALRYDSPVQLVGRFPHEDVEIAGRAVRRDTPMLVLVGAAGRDPAVFPDPARFDLTRENAGEHLSFSGGAHYCLGAPLARLEGEIALRTLVRRFPHLRAAEAPRRRRTTTIRGLARFPVHAGAGSRPVSA